MASNPWGAAGGGRPGPALGPGGEGRWRGFALVLLGCVAGCTSGAAAPSGEPFDEARAWRQLQAIVAFGERPSGTPKNRALRDYLVAELRAAGLSPVVEPFRAATPVGELEFANVFADLPPTGGPADEAPLVVLATHFDTKRLPFRFVGANDGGSGTAVLLELARALAASQRTRAHAYRLLFLDGEEAVQQWWEDPDNTYGSRHHVAELRRTGQLRRVQACVLLDMVGDADLRLTADRSSTPALLELFFVAARDIGLGRHVGGVSKEVLDDHLPFLAADVPSVDLIDLEFGPGNELWHTAADTLENCSQASLGATGRIVLAGLPRLERWLAERRAH